MNIKPHGTTRRLIWSKDTVDQYEIYEYARDIRVSQVRSLKTLLRSKMHWEAPIVVMLKPGQRTERFLIVDGQHRYTAFTELLDELPDLSIIVNAIQYDYEKSAERINEIFEQYGGRQVKQTLNDRLQMMWPLLSELHPIIDDGFPVKVSMRKSGMKDAWSLASLLSAYFNRNNTPDNNNPHGKAMLEHARRARKDDVEAIQEFVIIHRQVFGPPTSMNPACWPSSLEILIRLYFQNTSLGRNELIARFDRLVADESMKYWGRNVSSVGRQNLALALLTRLNAGRKKNLFVLKTRNIK